MSIPTTPAQTLNDLAALIFRLDEISVDVGHSPAARKRALKLSNDLRRLHLNLFAAESNNSKDVSVIFLQPKTLTLFIQRQRVQH